MEAQGAPSKYNKNKELEMKIASQGTPPRQLVLDLEIQKTLLSA